MEMRTLVGPLEEALYDNPTGALVFPFIPSVAYESVFDFGCGCGRVARQLIQQRPTPRRYVGIDLHRGMVQWCQANLKPSAPNFDFIHHDVFNISLNPGEGRAPILPFPVEARAFSLVIAHSVFTHLVESQAAHYLAEVARVLRPDGILYSTWFIFDKSEFPMMQPFQNALYINDIDPTNAVVYDKAWLRSAASSVGLTISLIIPPALRGFQWHLLMTPSRPGVADAEFPPDSAPPGIMRPPLMPPDAHKIGGNQV